MKIGLFAITALILLCAYLPATHNTPLVDRNTSFSTGEQLTYRVNFGFFHVGTAVTKIDSRVYNVNSTPCFKVDAYGETADWISWVTHVKDVWGAYLDTTSLSTQVAYRKIREGNYKKDELANFNHRKKKVEVKVMNQQTGVYENPKEFDIPTNAKDLVGGFMLLRQIDFRKVKVGDTLTVSGFFEDTSYYLRIIYKGKDAVQTRVGKIPCHKLVPIMPDNKMFDGENSITCWLSEDENKIPVKIQAKMFIGHTGLELEGFRGLKNQLRIQF